MDRKRQLSNVAFGGAWSEQIADREEVAAARECLRHAAARAATCDPRRAVEVAWALTLLCGRHPKGALLRAAWARAVSLEAPGSRVAELGRIAALLSAAVAAEGPR